ncbi:MULTISPECIES: acyl-CoA dehydrogenase family protein [unclassified Modestobacter]|uniref:acyl-CoA dehydrogenase family protein n=1 Tax=unclassified Modestobacter TaxID=2643866 RepID=UPI0022AAE671|nr:MULTISPECIES: acyl-CoA dehydrogenase family protein [unclassified Modestobacter]MCZ2823291.1 acyl-CoA dehydrogenase family protein [Modestobacter sp. VKM Ac-2981]MCZ2851536.1 acyl-CoA dehydrogenase family protein [Modestobacter sp. VKM Ac-2982]
MTSTASRPAEIDDTWPPQPPVLHSPWHTPERAALMEQARRFAMDEVLPVANELDPQKGEIPQHLLERLGELGWFGITVAAADGGLGLGVFEYCMVSEELARAWMSVASILARSQGMGTAVADPDRRRELLRRSAGGSWIGAVALSEPEAGSDLANVQTRAVRDGDDWVVTGRKRWCGNAKAADFIQVLVRVADPQPGESRSRGLRNLLLVKERGAFPPGLSGHAIDKVGYHGFLTWDLTFDGVRIPAADLIVAPGEGGSDSGAGFREAQAFLNTARVHTAARAVGLARAAVEDCVLYLQERAQFGHPIGDFQALRFALAEMAADVEQARAFYRQVAHLLDEGVPCEREAAMVKLQATEMAVRVTNQAMQLHGGNGYTTERQVERHWRDARLTTIFEGTSEIQKRIISNTMLPRSPLG